MYSISERTPEMELGSFRTLRVLAGDVPCSAVNVLEVGHQTLWLDCKRSKSGMGTVPSAGLHIKKPRLVAAVKQLIGSAKYKLNT